MFITNIGFGGYRSFGNGISWLEDLKKVNLLIGANNSGKSNVLRYIYERLYSVEDFLGSGSKLQVFSPEDCCRFTTTNVIEVGLVCRYSRSGSMSEYLLNANRASRSQKLLRDVEPRITEGLELRFYYDLRLSQGITAVSAPQVVPSFESLLTQLIPAHELRGWGNISDELADCKDVWAGLSRFAKNKKGKRPVSLLTAHRKLTSDVESNQTLLSGVGLIRTIGTWINYIGTDVLSRSKGERLEQFVRAVTGYSDAKLRLVKQDSQIEIELGDESFSLEDMATGLHELVLLAAYCTEIEESVICLEEPETHLHPTWQRALIDYLQNKTSNQYFIATHSAHIIDIPDVPVFQVRRDGSYSIVSKIDCDDHALDSLRQLGYRASDLLQANYVLWVEGPSDRLYLLYWLKLVLPELKEGVHFSVMYYGGSMLGHLSGLQMDEDPEAFSSRVPEPILLSRLNQHFGVVMDSDWTSAVPPASTDQKWVTKQKCKQELESKHKFAWITHGRTIENYCVVEDLEAAVRKMNDRHKYVSPADIYQPAYQFVNTKKNKVEDKVSLANAYVQVQKELVDAQFSSENTSDDFKAKRDFLIERLKKEPTGKLYDHLVELANAIHKAQGKPIPPSA
ncbi:MAG: AAA family ATPase [Candidatus Obscuribacter sp.]|nr:AAA family ATPase [Candidatus Obscuribacter sp.]MBK9279607.1 AAA family ATPase [Candidatus Obscuribacter sp.]